MLRKMKVSNTAELEKGRLKAASLMDRESLFFRSILFCG